MSDKLDDNAPLAGISGSGAAPATQEDSGTLLGRLVDPRSYQDEQARPDQPGGLVNDMLKPLLGAEGREPRNPDAEDTTENSEG